jgi:LysR family glycine cleavage system transcriptional activator
MRKLPPLNAVRAFEAAARHVSLTQAARELSVTHGAISKQVATLEAWLGTPVFVRSPTQLTLTDAGRTLLAAVTPALDRISVAATHLLEQKDTRTLTVHAPPTVMIRWLIPRLSNFQRRAPTVDIRFAASAAPLDFEAGGYNIAIRGGYQPPEGVVAIPFMTETILPICHPDLLEGGRLRRPQDLERQTLLSYDSEPMPWVEWLALAQKPALRPAHALQFEQMFLALQAASEGLGIVLVPLSMVADDIITGKLCAPFGVSVSRKRQYFALIAPGWHGNPVVETFCDWLIKEGEDTERFVAGLVKTMAPA